jgi:hypothetical protein
MPLPLTDANLCKIVYSELRDGYLITASLTRFGGLCVVATREKSPTWQGDNIIEARNWVDTCAAGQFEIIEHTETVRPERFVVFRKLNGRTERALHLGRRGGFRTMAEATEAIANMKP